jgi:hypothetical protein
MGGHYFATTDRHLVESAMAIGDLIFRVASTGDRDVCR